MKDVAMSTSCHTSLQNTPKMLKNHPQNRPKIDPKINKKSIQQPIRKIIILDRFGIDFWSIFDRFWPQLGLQDGLMNGRRGRRRGPGSLLDRPYA